MKYPTLRVPKPHQTEAARFIYKVERALLAHEMGTGKTQCVLHFIGCMLWAKKINRALIICKLRGLAVWEDEIRQCMPDPITYSVFRPGPISTTWAKSDLVITNYDYARTHFEDLKKLQADVVVFDESHRIKNPNARQSRLAHKLGKLCRYAVAMTGTPIGNRPHDIWSQFRFLKPDLLEEKFADFKDRYTIFKGFGGHEIHRYRDLDRLGKILAPYTSVQKKTIAVGKVFIEVPIDMPLEAKKRYREMDTDLITYVNSETAISAPIVLAKLAKLSQISGGFLKDTETEQIYPLHTAKFEALKELTDSLLEQGEKRVVVYARFIYELEQIKALLAPDWVTFSIRGGVTVTEQKLAESLFKESGGAMICQIASGSESINLQSCHYTIYYSMDYSMINFQQSQDRTHREGQKSGQCFYYVLLCRGTRDRQIYNILRNKREMAQSMIEMIRKERTA